MKGSDSFKMGDLSYTELSSWTTVAIVFTMLCYYINKLATLDTTGMLNSVTHNRLILLVVVITIVTEIIFQIVVAVSKRVDAEAAPDERDEMFHAKATKISSGFLFGFIAILILIVAQSDFLIEQLALNLRGLSPKDVLLSVLVIGFGMAQFAHHLTLAIYYRRGS